MADNDLTLTTYRVTNHVTKKALSPTSTLAERGGNGVLAGASMKCGGFVPHKWVNVTGVMDSHVDGLRIATYYSKIKTTTKTIIGVYHQCAWEGKGKTIISCGLLEHFGHHVDDRSRKTKYPGKQQIMLMSGHAIPLQYRNVLPYFDQEHPSDEDMEKYEHVDMTSPADWDPKVLSRPFRANR